MVRSICRKRDLGSGEICLYLLSDTCYPSDFSPVYLRLNFRRRAINLSEIVNGKQPLSFKKNIY